MHIELLLLGSLLGSLAIVIKLTGRLQRSWVERDLRVGDLRALSDIAFRRIDGPAFDQVERLCKRGFLRMPPGGLGRMTMKGWVAVLFRNTSARENVRPRAGHRSSAVAAAGALMMTAWPTTAQWVAGVCAGGLPGTEAGMTTSG